MEKRERSEQDVLNEHDSGKLLKELFQERHPDAEELEKELEQMRQEKEQSKKQSG